MRECGYEYDRLPAAAHDEIARLEIELYDARSTIFHMGSAVLIGLGILGLVLGWFGGFGKIIYTGGPSIMWSGLLLAIIGVVYFVKSDRANRWSMD